MPKPTFAEEKGSPLHSTLCCVQCSNKPSSEILEMNSLLTGGRQIKPCAEPVVEILNRPPVRSIQFHLKEHAAPVPQFANIVSC